MKKLLALALVLCLVLSAAIALADEFKMGIDAEYPPFSYLDDDGNYAGFDVEMCKAACDILGLEQVIVPVNWDTKLISLDNKEHDCVWSGMTILDTMKEDEEGQLELAKTFEGGAPVTMENFNICGTELDAGGVDAVVIDLPVAQNLAGRFNGFVILDAPLGSEQYGICFRNGDDELCKKFEEAIMKLVEDGTYLELAKKYNLDENVLCLLNK